ncbi:metallophosphoesterase family protein [Paracoccus luteus]|uniref:metallophosphoesterase family protein n=1 Tax=Paracoccus luteus TaxID=2508543 RepID=UPI00106F2637|nr:DNA repair exonuclease [Paracoccus luteus]
MSFRFVHAADLHLDSPLRSLALRAPQVADLIGTATRQALVAIVDLCLAERVDALLIAGDLYDGDQTSMKTARFLAGQLGRLHAAGIAVHIIRGNHDALSRITRELVLPDSVHVYGDRAQAVPLARPDGHAPVVLHGISFARPHAPDSLLPHYAPPTAGAINIGLMHSSLGGAPGHDVYAPVSAADLGGFGYDYWALGHIHKPGRSMAGRAHVVMPGNPQGRDVGESGVRGVVLATVGADGRITLQDRPTSLAEFARVNVDVAGIDDWAALVARIRSALEQARMGAQSPHLVARVHVTGATPLAWRIRRDLDLLTAEAEQAGADTGNVWIEKLDIACTLPGDDAAPTGAGPLAELRGLIGTEVLASPVYRADLTAAADELLRALPSALRPRFGTDPLALAALLDDLAREGSDAVLARLDGPQGAA